MSTVTTSSRVTGIGPHWLAFPLQVSAYLEFSKPNGGTNLSLDSNVDFSVSNFENFQIPALALCSGTQTIRFMRKPA
jgi:hypothetical protein